MTNNLIQWPRAKYWDRAWNPIVGCKPCSPACEHCYAAALAKRFGQSFEPHTSSQTRPPRKGVVFCGNMTDLFGDWMWPDYGKHGYYITKAPEDLIALACGKTHNEAVYLWLTKRVGAMTDAVNRAFDDHEWRKTRRYYHYFGFTAENQEWYDRRRDALYHNWPSWANMWVSCEPLLGPIDLHLDNVFEGSCSWIVVGCESGPHRRPCEIEWVEPIVEQCRAAGVPVFVKQLDLNGKCVTDINQFPEHLRIRQVPWATTQGGNTK